MGDSPARRAGSLAWPGRMPRRRWRGIVWTCAPHRAATGYRNDGRLADGHAGTPGRPHPRPRRSASPPTLRLGVLKAAVLGLHRPLWSGLEMTLVGAIEGALAFGAGLWAVHLLPR